MGLYYVANLYKDIDYKKFIEIMCNYADSFFLRVSRSRIGDKYNFGRDEFMSEGRCIISESSRSKYYADIHCQITPSIKEKIAKYVTPENGLCCFGFYKNNLRILCVEECFMAYVVIPDDMYELKAELLKADIKIDTFAAVMEPWAINDKGYEFYAKNPAKAKDIKFLMG